MPQTQRKTYPGHCVRSLIQICWHFSVHNMFQKFFLQMLSSIKKKRSFELGMNNCSPTQRFGCTLPIYSINMLIQLQVWRHTADAGGWWIECTVTNLLKCINVFLIKGMTKDSQTWFTSKKCEVFANCVSKRYGHSLKRFICHRQKLFLVNMNQNFALLLGQEAAGTTCLIRHETMKLMFDLHCLQLETTCFLRKKVSCDVFFMKKFQGQFLEAKHKI